MNRGKKTVYSSDHQSIVFLPVAPRWETHHTEGLQIIVLILG